MMVFVRKRARALLLGLVLVTAGLAAFGYCKKDDGNKNGLLLLLALAAMRTDACAANSSSGFVVILPCGVAQ